MPALSFCAFASTCSLATAGERSRESNKGSARFPRRSRTVFDSKLVALLVFALWKAASHIYPALPSLSSQSASLGSDCGASGRSGSSTLTLGCFRLKPAPAKGQAGRLCARVDHWHRESADC